MISPNLDRVSRSSPDALHTIEELKRRRVGLWLLDLGAPAHPCLQPDRPFHEAPQIEIDKNHVAKHPAGQSNVPQVFTDLFTSDWRPTLAGNRIQQTPCVGMLRCGEHLCCLAQLDNSPALHHRDPTANLGRHS